MKYTTEYITQCPVFKHCEKGTILDKNNQPTCVGCNTWTEYITQKKGEPKTQ